MMNRLYQSKKGAAAFYVVIFTMLLLSVITMSFIRIMVSEATKSTNDDLSKSAYDSALAGVEDAKIVLVKYHQCLDQGEVAKKDGNTCQHIIWAMQNGGCDTVALALKRNGNSGGEVKIKETISSSPNSEDMEQAYTCVKLSEDLEDYRAELSSEKRIRVIPIRTGNLADGSATNLDNVHGIRFSWSSPSVKYLNQVLQQFNSDWFVNANEAQKYIPPIAVDFYQTDTGWFSLGELSTVNNSHDGTDHFSLLFQPNSSGGVGTGSKYYTKEKVIENSDKADDSPVKVQCTGTADFQCSVDIELPKPFRGGSRNLATTLLRVELPYGGDQKTDFSIQLCTGNGSKLCDTTVNFVGVQAQIDSTGRANDLFRRVDTRVELIDTNFPYPEFAAQLTGNSGMTTEKNFWVTHNCWTSDDEGDERNPNVGGCPNTGTVSGS